MNYTSSSSSSSSSSSPCERSVADIGDRGLRILSVVSNCSHDELIVGRFSSRYEIIQTVCVFCALPSSAFGTTNLSTQYYFAFLVHQLCLYMPKNCSCLFLMVLSRDLLYPAISITSFFTYTALFHIHEPIFSLFVPFHMANNTIYS